MKCVLVIENQAEVREAIVEMLAANGYEGLTAANGRQALELAQQHLPNVIICDIGMPELDGHGVLTELQRDPITASIPFIFLTAKAQVANRRRGMLLGADDYLTKPFTFAELHKAVETRLAKQSTLERKFQVKLANLRFIRTFDTAGEFGAAAQAGVGTLQSRSKADLRVLARGTLASH